MFKKILELIFWKKNKINLKFIKKYSVANKSYESFYIPKKSWEKRLIESPNSDLKSIQKLLLKDLEKTFLLPWFVTAFRKKYSIKTNAKKHINKKIVINIDIENFFHSISSEKIRKTLSFYENITENEIDNFINIVTYNNKLPQWAPTSPFVANLVFLWIDNIIIKLLKKYDKKVSYTRYADDITFSSNNQKIKNAIRIITESLLPKYWYNVKKKKTTIYRKHRKQLVTWLIVNERVALPRNKYMILRSAVYNFLKKWEWNIDIIRWNLAFLKNVDKKKYNKLKFYYRRNFKENRNYKILFQKK